MMNHTVERGLERLAVASIVLQGRLDYLEMVTARDTKTYKAMEERSTVRWLITLLNRDVNRPILEHARWTPMPNEVTDTDLEPEA